MDDCTINVMMFGGRRCGKTSVIAAMNRNFADVFGKTDLVISTQDYDTMVAIEDKEREIRRFFADDKKPYGEFPTDENGTVDDSNYEFDIQLKGRENKSTITLSFYDFPGEWLNDKEKGKERNQILAEKMKTCGVIMIAIDTPYLMEPLSDVLHPKDPKKNMVGTWNDQRNYSRRIATMVKNYFNPRWGPERKMILFVPLKCEKYYAARLMDKVSKKIREAYKDLLDYVEGENSKNYEVAITPILTFGAGTVFFSRFREDADGNPVDEKGNPVTDSKRYPASLFKFENRAADYSPAFCEQPLLYALSYLLCQVEEAKKNEKLPFFRRFIQAMGETFGNWASAEDFLGQREKIQRHLRTSGDGYDILYDPLHLGREISIPEYGNKFQTLWRKMGWNREKI